MCLSARALRSGPRPFRKTASESVDMVCGSLPSAEAGVLLDQSYDLDAVIVLSQSCLDVARTSGMAECYNYESQGRSDDVGKR